MKRTLLLLCGVLSLTACHKKEPMAALPKPVKLPSLSADAVTTDSPAPVTTGTETAPAATAAAAPVAPDAPAAAEASPAPAAEPVESRPLTPQELERLRYIVYMFREEHGRYPASLTDLSANGMLTGFSAPIPNDHVAYDPATGNLVASK